MARTWDLFGWRPEDAPVDPFEDLPVTPAAWLLALPVRGYRLAFSPWVGHNCRFQPTCSAYALEALEPTAPSAAAGSPPAASSAATPGAAPASTTSR